MGALIFDKYQSNLIFIDINSKFDYTMGCGCKNKTNQTPEQIAAQAAARRVTTQESVKDAIKKTVEKYYNKN